MLIKEFAERTGYQPTIEEYRYIEQSYYDCDEQKDEFCKNWLRDNANGTWAKELKLRKALDEQKAKYEAALTEKEEDINFFCRYFDLYRKEHEQFMELKEYLGRVMKSIEKRI